MEAAIARAKARKQEQQAGSEPAEPADPRKAAVAAAIARVQAKKQHSSRLLTRIKWYSESQARLIPITSARHRESCCWY
ncbi:electron transport complex protein RnfC [Salmonella enterica subsp. enterica serovar Heidelberg str. 76-0300]|nr:electron transport complex protein RnfC [Salmonella enterica subsp. enterica serovar Heidelberg str. 24393]KJT87062.1 electron transport complex protein RnfC [Salmonella enterica subsp. enterica serovar Heidelberg str. 76-0300]